MLRAEPPEQPPETRFLALGRHFWGGRACLRAWLLSAGIVFFLLATLAAQVGLNHWSRAFFDALEKRDLAAVWMTAGWLPLVILLSMAAATALVITRMALQVRWREWLTGAILGRWITRERAYRLPFVAPDQGAPEYRIAEDVRLAVDPLVEFAIGFLGACATAITFAAILWQVAGSTTLPLFGMAVTIPGYMALAAILYALLVTGLIALVGRPLILRVSAKNEQEARFRAGMTRLRENAESIGLLRGDPAERAAALRGFGQVAAGWFAIIRQQARVGLVLNANGALFPILPLLLVAPKYLSGALTLGAVMQVVSAFVAVQGALIWFVDNFVRIAEWYASVLRVDELLAALEEADGADGTTRVALLAHDADTIVFDRLRLVHSGGETVIADGSAVIARGEKVLMSGASGTGKSSLVRAMAGLWRKGSGRILLPRGARISFVPQQAYLPTGSLRSVLTYPAPPDSVGDALLSAALDNVGLGALAARLDDEAAWERILSGGERQRVAVARLLIQRPDVVILDEFTSALDEEGQRAMLGLLDTALADATVISIGHRPGLEQFHDRRIALEQTTRGAVFRELRAPARLGLAARARAGTPG
ncbi:ABC transporter ATP-binding protein/permease [Rhabdaerophilum calidifontis]|uniref:ABC transporter ATP-binding protein/permease n=1 Tax=Rhabdaerophilum calidifontis TaxID=2604328 RepID=UPI00123A8FE5|nr:ABC transporter ATP-binding protein/permease [Rhabdaerophilum calidifontis]